MEGGIRSAEKGPRAFCYGGARIHSLWQAAIHLRLNISTLFWVGLSFASLGTFFCNRNNRGLWRRAGLSELFNRNGEEKVAGIQKKKKHLWSTCDILQPG